MKKVHIAFDVDGTLRKNTEEIHRTEIVENTEIVHMLMSYAKMKNTVVHIWSNRGEEYCKMIRLEMHLQNFVKQSDCHKKLWLKDQVKLMSQNKEFFKPDIAIDDQQRFDGGHINLIVRMK